MAERSSENIQRDIERTRAEMSETIDALEQRLSPGELFDEFWGRMKSGDTGHNVGETIRDHPVPLALMGLGLGWLAIEKATESRTGHLRSRHGHPGEGTYSPADGRVGPYRGDDVIDPEHRYGKSGGMAEQMSDAAGNVKDRVTGMGGEMKDRISSATESARDRISDAGEAVRNRADGAGSRGDGGSPGLTDRMHHLRDSADGEMRQARDSMRGRASQLERGFRSLLEDYPLALGAVTFGLGLAAGASAPTSDVENEFMGDASDTMKDEVKHAAGETTRQAREVAEDAVQAARTEANNQGMGDDLKSKAEQVVKAASSTAREEAESKGLTPDAMKDRAREAGHKTAESAKQSATGHGGSQDRRPGGGGVTQQGSSAPPSSAPASRPGSPSPGFSASPPSQGSESGRPVDGGEDRTQGRR